MRGERPLDRLPRNRLHGCITGAVRMDPVVGPVFSAKSLVPATMCTTAGLDQQLSPVGRRRFRESRDPGKSYEEQRNGRRHHRRSQSQTCRHASSYDSGYLSFQFAPGFGAKPARVSSAPESSNRTIW